jgi:hypothetical protein
MNIDVKTSSSFPNMFNQSLSFTSEKMANNLPFVVIGSIVILGFLLFISTIPNSKQSSGMYSGISSYGLNRLSSSSTSSSSSSSSVFYIVEILIWSMVVFLVVINGLKYILDIDITSQLTGLFSHDPNLNVHVKSKGLESHLPKPTKSTGSVSTSFGKEVFHISDNNYTYSDAKAVCKAYNAELANYDQIKKSHTGGAEWCSYGWSDDQMVFFPTQKTTYENLKKKKGHEHDCGRPGINGGYISNPNAKFGVNCYGKKPKNANGMQFATVEYKTQEDRAIDKKVLEFKNKLNNMPIAPFNKSKWSKF